MPRGGLRPGAGRKPKTIKTLVAEINRSPEAVAIADAGEKETKTPLEFMLDAMNDPNVPKELRARMAIAAAPYVHPKADDLKPGKKEQQQSEAENVSSRYATPAQPKLVVNNA